jgi:dTDP-4-dehydrorhamnose reductase
MKKILIFGSSGMAGHMVYKFLESTNKYDLMGISRVQEPDIKSQIFDIEDELVECIEYVCQYKPDVIINCIGVLVKASNDDPTRAIFTNSFWPHVLESVSLELNSRLIHISTDCVFDGKNGPYNETDWPTEKNWYGRSKAMGEVVNDRDLTIRTSIIGPELKDDHTGLFEWFMQERGEVSGFVNVVWNGITTLELAKQIDKIIDIDLTGLYHLITEVPIAKGELLALMQKVFQNTAVKIKPTATNNPSNKVLLNNRITEYNPNIPIYQVQLEEMKEFYTKINEH